MEYAAPTGEQCSKHAKIYEDESVVAYALWYPQMGGYVGKAVAEISKPGGCIDVYIWHDGEFPFDDDDKENPRFIHHCEASQFIEFGQFLLNAKREHGIND